MPRDSTPEERAEKGDGQSRLAAAREVLRQRAAAAQRGAGETAASAEEVLTASLASGGAYDSSVGFDDGRRKSRTQEMAERATETGKAVAPTDHTLDLGTDTGVATEMARGTVEPDWGNNPEHLDTPAEVRAEFRDDGLDPIDVDTAARASFGHFLVHGMANEPDMGGRTPEQLEAEHDLAVAAMREYGYDHHSPLDLGVGRGDDEADADDPFEFDDPFGVAGGVTTDVRE